MFEFAPAEFDSLMFGYPKFRRKSVDVMVVGGSAVLGQDELVYTDGRTTVTFIGSSAAMLLRITRKQKKAPDEVLVDSNYTDFGAVRETLREHIA